MYTTGGFSLFFSLLMVPHTVATLRGGAGSFLQAIYGSLSIFAAFWWMVCAITITSERALPLPACPGRTSRAAEAPARALRHASAGSTCACRTNTTSHFLSTLLPSPRSHPPAVRGGQASDAGYQSGTARNAVIGLSWVQMVLFLAGFVAVVYDR